MTVLTAAELAEMQRETASRLYQVADRWRIIPGATRRTLYLANERVSIYPGGDTNITDDQTGVVGQRATYIGYAARSSDVDENDQYRNVRDALSGAVYMPDVRFTVGTAERHRTVIRMRMHEEGT